MEIDSLTLIYFSPTLSTKKYMNELSTLFSVNEVETIDLTKKSNRDFKRRAIKSDCVIIGFPVYEEYVPEILIAELNKMVFNNQPLIGLAIYGKIGFGMSLRQIYDYAVNHNLKPMIMGAFIAEHSFSSKVNKLAYQRPDHNDFIVLHKLFLKFKEKMENGAESLHKDDIPGSLPLMAKVLPKNSAKLFTKSPQINDHCNYCGVCRLKCPVEAISDELTVDEQKCIRCFACVKSCKKDGRDIRFKMRPLVEFVLKKNEKKSVGNLII